MSKKKYNGENLPDLDLSARGPASSNLAVVVRCRPQSEKDLLKNSPECVTVLNDALMTVTEPFDLEGHPGSEKAKSLSFEFSRVFPKTASNQEVYGQTGKPFIQGLFEGVNATVFAYGARSSGKTFTMLGAGDEQGIVSFCINDVLAQMDSSERVGSVLKVSFVEIFNEVVRDLLVGDDKNLDIREDPVKGVTLNGVSEVPTSLKKDIMKMLK